MIHIRSLHGPDEQGPLALLVLGDPEHHLVECLPLIVQPDGHQPFFALSGMIRQLQRQGIIAFVLRLPELNRLLAVEVYGRVSLEMLGQIRHVLLDKLDALIKGRLVVEECARRLLIHKAVFLSNARQLVVAGKESLQPLHLLWMQEAADDEDDTAPCLARILHIVYLLTHANCIKHTIPYSYSVKLL